jgi:hypothetical protein
MEFTVTVVMTLYIGLGPSHRSWQGNVTITQTNLKTALLRRFSMTYKGASNQRILIKKDNTSRQIQRKDA